MVLIFSGSPMFVVWCGWTAKRYMMAVLAIGVLGCLEIVGEMFRRLSVFLASWLHTSYLWSGLNVRWSVDKFCTRYVCILCTITSHASLALGRKATMVTLLHKGLPRSRSFITRWQISFDIGDSLSGGC